MPANETLAFWWLINAAEMDKSKAPSLLSRSLACLRLELQASRCATSSKLRKEWSNRSETNSRAADLSLIHI